MAPFGFVSLPSRAVAERDLASHGADEEVLEEEVEHRAELATVGSERASGRLGGLGWWAEPGAKA
jgi:hypothetical protein